MNSSPEILNWSIVNLTHKTQRAVYHVGKSVHSLLCTENGNNSFSDKSVSFYLPKSNQYFNDYNALLYSFNNDLSFRVFRKLAKNQWIYLGRRKISSIDSSSVANNHVFIINLI